MEIAAVCFRFALALLFVGAGSRKLLRRSDFTRAVRGYELLPERVAGPFALVLPLVEIVAGALLAAGLATRLVSFVLVGLLTAFTGAIGINLARGRKIDCGCLNSVAPQTIGWTLVVRNLVLAGMAAVVGLKAPTVLAVDDPAVGTASMSSNEAIALLAATVLALGALALGRSVARTSAIATATLRRLEETAAR